MSISILSVAFLALLLTVEIIEIYRGAKRGFFKSVISFSVVLASVLISITVSPIIAQWIAGFVKFNLSLGNRFESIAKPVNVLLNSLFAMGISTVIFVLAFFLIRGIIALIVAAFMGKKLKAPKTRPEYGKQSETFIGRNNKTLGAVFGGITAFVITVVLTSPIMGTLKLADRAFDIVDNNKLTSELKIDKKIPRDVKVYSKDVLGNVFYHFGGKLMYHSTATAELYGEQVYIMSEIDTVDAIVTDFMYISKVLQKPAEVKNSHLKRMESLCESIEQQKILKGVLAGGIANASEAWLNGESYLGIKKPMLNNIVAPAFDEVLEVCRQTKTSGANKNAVTLLKLYSVILRSDILLIDTGDFDAMMEAINSSGIINEIELILGENPNMRNISVSAIAMSIVADRIKNYDYDEINYSSLMDNIADAINTVNTTGYETNEEKVDALTSYAEKYLKDYGYDVPEDIAKATAEELIKAFGSSGITTEDVRALFEKYSG